MPPARATEPWDVDSADALARLYESDAGDPRKGRDRPRGTRADIIPPPAPTGDRGGAWLDARIAEIAARLQQSVADLAPDKSLSVLNGRLDQLQERFTDALQDVAQRSDVEGLRLIEAHVTDLTGHLEDARSQLARLDAIEGHVRDLARKLDDGDQQRFDGFENLLQDYIAEWRRGEEHTGSVLHTIEQMLARIHERVEAIEAANPAPQSSLSAFDAFSAPELPAARFERAPLAAAPDDTRALGPKCYRPTLDAADYAPAPRPAAREPEPEPRSPVPAAPAVLAADAPVPASAETEPARPRDDFRASLIRARLKTSEAAAATADAAAGEPAGAKATPAGRARAQAPATGSGPRPGLLLAAVMALLAGGGYLLVDVILSAPGKQMPAHMRSGAVQVEQAPGAAASAPTVKPALAEPRMQAGAPQPAMPAAKPEAEARRDAQEDATVPSPAAPPRRPHVPETMIDDLSENAPARAAGSPAPKTGDAAGRVWHRPQPAAAIEDMPLARGATPADTGLPATIGPASLRQAAANGEPAAQFEVGVRFAEGRGVDLDYGQASTWYRRAAMRGHAPAQFRLAMLYERGMGLPADAERARVWYTRAAEQGHVKAMHNLAVLSTSSRGDAAAAVKWFTAAAELGLTDSQFNIAVLHLSGQGVPRDLQAAYKWFALAARNGDKEAARRLGQVKSQLPAAELAAAEATVQAWRSRRAEQKPDELAGAGRAIGE